MEQSKIIEVCGKLGINEPELTKQWLGSYF